MAYGNRWLSACILLALCALISTPAHAQTQPRLVVELSDTVLHAADGSGYVTVFVTHPLDAIEGFELKISSLDSQALAFSLVPDTVGMACAGWKLFMPDGFPGGIHIAALANQFGHFNVPPIPADSNSLPLIRFHYTVSLPVLSTPQTISLSIDTSLSNFGFANPQGNLIGVTQHTVIDTLCFRCTSYDSLNNCLQYAPTAEPPCDSVYYEQSWFTILDTALTHVYNGSVYVLTCCEGPRGNFSFDAANVVDLADLSGLISYLVANGPAARCQAEADINGSGLVDLTDLSMLIAFLLSSRPLPSCP